MVGADLCVRPFGGPTRRSAPTSVRQSGSGLADRKMGYGVFGHRSCDHNVRDRIPHPRAGKGQEF